MNINVKTRIDPEMSDKQRLDVAVLMIRKLNEQKKIREDIIFKFFNVLTARLSYDDIQRFYGEFYKEICFIDHLHCRKCRNFLVPGNLCQVCQNENNAHNK